MKMLHVIIPLICQHTAPPSQILMSNLNTSAGLMLNFIPTEELLQGHEAVLLLQWRSSTFIGQAGWYLI